MASNPVLLSPGTTETGTTSIAISQPGHSFAVLDAICFVGGQWVKAQADSEDTAAFGIVVKVIDVNDFKFAQFGRYELPAHGLTPGVWYYLSGTTAGDLSTTPGLINQPMVFAETSSKIMVYPYRPSTAADYLTLTGSSVVRSGFEIDGEVSQAITVTQNAHGFLSLNCIRHNGSAWVAARSDDLATTAHAVITEVIDANTFKYAISGRFEVPSHGLTPNTWYYLSSTIFGGMTTVEPSFSQPVVFVESAGAILVFSFRAIDTAIYSPPTPLTDHAQLTGLLVDDHTQYHTDARGDVRYYLKSDVDTALSFKADDVHFHDGSEISGVLFDSSVAESSVTQHQAALAILEAQITDLDKYTQAEIDFALLFKISTSQKGVANGVATLDGAGKIPTAQLPTLSVADIFTVGSEAAQLALTANAGDVAIRTDENKSYIHNGGSAGTMADWSELLTPTSAVLSVAGKTGAVTLVKADVGLSNVDNTTDLSKPISTATQTALDGKVDDAQVLTNVPAGALFTDTIYTHPTTAGNVHLPAAGSAGEYLKYLTAGTAQWASLATDVAATAAVTANTAKVSNATHTGDVTGSTVLTIAPNAVTFAKMATIATSTILGRITAATGAIETLSAANVRTIINVEDGANAYVHPGTHPWAILTSTPTTLAGYGIVDAAPLVHTHIVANVTGLQTALDGKVDDAQVLTNVPAGALFTDTIYTHPATHPWSILTATPTTLSGYGISDAANISHTHTIANVTGLQTALDGKVDDAQVLTDVPAGALFTDTVYTHPNLTALTPTLTGALVLATFTTNAAGHVTAATTRTLTLANLGYTGAVDANNYVHPTGPGNNHLPTGGATGDYLKYSGSGTALWANFDTDVANNAAIALNTAKVTNATHTGEVTGATVLTIAANAVVTAKIADANVTLAKLANIATASLLGRTTAGTGVPEVLSAATARTLLDVYTKAETEAAITGGGTLPDWATITNKPATFPPSAHSHIIADVTGLQSALDGKVDDSQVLENVPAGALFTDTIYTHPNDGVDLGAALTGASVISDVTVNVLGHVTGFATRALTLGNLGYTGAVDANNYVHPTTAGNLHVPAAGASGDYLKWSALGTAVWGSFATDVAANAAVAANTAKVTNATHTGDVTGSVALTIANNAVTLAKMATIATDSFLGRDTAATGNVEVLSAAVARTILNVADGANNYVHPTAAGSIHLPAAGAAGDYIKYSGTAGTGAWASLATDVAATAAVTANTAKVTNATHTGDVTGATALTIAASAVTLAKMADMATASFIGRATAATGVPEVLSAASARTVLDVYTKAETNAAISGGGTVPDWAAITNKPTTFPPEAHTHVIADVTGLSAALDGKVDDAQVLTNVPLGALFTDTVYTHPTTAGNLHVPAAGASGDYLKWSALGTAAWGSFATDVAANAAVAANTAKVTNATHTGDVTGATALTIANSAVTLAKMANVVTASILGRVTAATGVVEVLTAAQVRTLLNVADGATAYVHPTTSGNIHIPAAGAAGDYLKYSGTAGTASWGAFATDVAATAAVTANTAKVTNATHTGDVTGATALTIAAGAVTLAKMANMATASFIGRTTAATGVPEVLTKAQALAILNVADGANNYVHPTTAGNIHVPAAGASGDYLKWTALGTAVWGAFATDVAANSAVAANTAKVTNATHTGDVTGATALTIANSAVTLAKMANITTASILGRVTAATGVVEVLTAAQVRTLINVADGATAYVHPTTAGNIHIPAAGAAGDYLKYSAAGTAAWAALATDVAATAAVTANTAKVTNATHTGDVTGSTALTIANSAVTLAKMADMATASVIYRKTAGTGAPEVQTLVTLKADMGISGTASGTNTGDQTITLTGDVTGSGTGSFAATIAANAVGLTKLADIATSSILGRVTASTGDPEVLTAAQVRTLLNVADGANNYVHPTTAGNIHVPAAGAAGDYLKYSAAGTAVWGAFATDVAATAAVTANTAKVTNATHTGDVTGDTALTIANNVVTLAKMATMATASFLGRTTAATGNVEVLSKAQALAVLNVADGANNYVHPTTAGNIHIPAAGAAGDYLKYSAAGTAVWGVFATDVAATAAVTANTAKVTNATHTGEVTGATALTITNAAVTLAKMANLAQNTIIGRVTASTGVPEALTAANVRTIINVADGANNYVHPTTAGNVHLPAAGATGDYIKYSGTAGTGAWGSFATDVNALVSPTYLAKAGGTMTGNLSLFGVYPGSVDESVGSVFYDVNLGTYLHSGYLLNQYDAPLESGFYIIGDSISASPGNGMNGAFNFDTNGSGTVVSPTITVASTGYKQDFDFTWNDAANLGEARFRITVSPTTGALTGVSLISQSGPLTANVVNRTVTLHSTALECWPHVLANRGANPHGGIEAFPGRTLALSYFLAPTATEKCHHAIIALGTNDTLNMPLDDGLSLSGAAPLITEASYKAALTARITAFKNAGYNVICMLTPYHQGWGGTRGAYNINFATTNIRKYQREVAALEGAVCWDIPHTNQYDNLHMTQAGADLFANDIYVRMAATIASDKWKSAEKFTFKKTGAAVNNLTMYQSAYLGNWFYANPEQNDQSYTWYTNSAKLVNMTGGGLAASDYVQAPKLKIKQAGGGVNDLEITQGTFLTADWAYFNAAQYAMGYTLYNSASAFVNITGGQVVASAAAPTDPSHLTRKDYVDGLLSGSNVTLTGAQTITGAKTFNTGGIVLNAPMTGNSTISVTGQITSGGACGGATIQGNNLSGASASDDYLLESNYVFGVVVKSNTKTSEIVKLAGSQTVTGSKTFTGGMVLNSAVTGSGGINVGGTVAGLSIAAVNWAGASAADDYLLESSWLYGVGVKSAVKSSNICLLTGAQTVAGIKTFSSELRCNVNIIAYYSDERLKDISGTLTDCLADVNSWRPVRYTAKEWTPFDSTVVDIGLLAQDVLATTPEAVKPAPFDPNYMTLQYERLVPVLVGAIQEMTKKMEAMEARITELEAH